MELSSLVSLSSSAAPEGSGTTINGGGCSDAWDLHINQTNEALNSTIKWPQSIQPALHGPYGPWSVV